MSPIPTTFLKPAARFYVSAVADPGILPRVIQVFAKRGMIPNRIDITPIHPASSEIMLDIQIDDLEDHCPHHMAEVLRQIIGVESTCIAERQLSLSA